MIAPLYQPQSCLFFLWWPVLATIFDMILNYLREKLWTRILSGHRILTCERKLEKMKEQSVSLCLWTVHRMGAASAGFRHLDFPSVITGHSLYSSLFIIRPRTLCMVSEHSTTELYTQAFKSSIFNFHLVQTVGRFLMNTKDNFSTILNNQIK